MTFSRVLLRRGGAMHLLHHDPTMAEPVSQQVEMVLDRCGTQIALILAAERELEEADAAVLGRALVAMTRGCTVRLENVADQERQNHVLELLAVLIMQGIGGFPSRGRPVRAND